MVATRKKRTPSGLDWECADSDTTYATHGIHRYSGKFIPQIADNAIKLLTEKDDVVLDLYAGSGTTLLESAIHKRRSIGIDLSPLAVLIAKVKTTPIEPGRLFAWRDDFLADIDVLESDSSQTTLPFLSLKNNAVSERLAALESDYRLSDDWYIKWFQKNRLRELVWLDINIQHIGDNAIKNLATVALSDVLRSSSNAHGSYPNVMFDKNKGQVRPVIPRFTKRLCAIIRSVSEIWDLIEPRYFPEVIEGNNTCLPLSDRSVDAIITHPPYIGSIPYAEYGLLSLTWIGKNPKELDAQLTGGQRQRKGVVEKFFGDYQQMFYEAHRVLKNGKSIFILVGSPTVRGEKIDLAEASITYAKEAGFSVTNQITRRGVNRRANLMGKETILFFKKGS